MQNGVLLDMIFLGLSQSFAVAAEVQTIFGMCSMLATMLTTNLFILWVMPRISAGDTDQWTSHQQLVDGLSRYYSIEKDKPIVFCHQNCYLRVTYGILWYW